MNDKNIEPYSYKERTAEERREIARQGGIYSGKARKEKKEKRDAWDIIRQMPLKDGDLNDIEGIQALTSVKGANITVEQAMIFAITQKALHGDTKAFAELQKYNDNLREKEIIRRRMTLENEKLQIEIDKLNIELEAYKKAAERADDSGVTIVDDINQAE